MSIAAKKIMMGSGSVALPSDDQFNRTSFLSHFDGSNDGVNNQFTDGSASNHTITANGNATQGSFNPYGTNWSVDFSRDTNPRLSSPASSDFTLGTGDFTIEFFVFFNTIAGVQKAIKQDIASGQTGFTVATGDGTGKFTFGGVLSETTSDAVANKWYHIAITRNSGVFRIFRNGVQTDTNTSSVNFGSAAKLVYGGSDELPIKGLMSNLRLVQGTSLYDSNFTTPTSPLTAVTNTKLLTLQSNRFVDNSASGHAVQPNTAKEVVTSFGPFLTSAVYDPAVNGASAYMDGTGDYLNTAASSEFAVGTGDFTISVWVYNLSGSLGLFDIGASGTGLSTGYDAPSIGITGSGAPGLYLFGFGGGSPVYSTAATGSTINEWEHIALVRSGSTVTFYKNGIAGATKTSSHDVTENIIAIGGYYSTSYLFKGYMSDFRLVKGTAVYTSNFTPPTAPLTAITNTKLLLNMADGQAIDSAAQNNLTLYGTAKTSTAQKLFGTASLLLDGNSDLATISSEAGNFGTGNFTIEFSFRLAANVGGTPNSCIAKWETSGSQRSWMVRIDNVSSANKIKFFDSADGSANSSTTFSTSFSSETWYKIAVVNVSGTVSLYVNGTADSTTHSLASGAPYASTGLVSIGANVPSSPDNFFNGNIDEVRLSKFARYTSNFTAPTEPFADKGQDA